MTPAEHGQERWQEELRKAMRAAYEAGNDRQVKAYTASIENIIATFFADRERALEAKLKQSGELLAESRQNTQDWRNAQIKAEADNRALVEAGNNVISDLERQGSVTSAHYNALRAALETVSGR